MRRFRSGAAAVALLLTATVAVGCRNMAPAVIAGATFSPVVREARPLSLTPQTHDWYRYLPDKAPGACLQTVRPLQWRFPGLNFGSWRAVDVHSRRPVMCAAGDSLTIEGGYVWDGAAIGTTTPRLLVPTLVHDALYHALMHRAPFARREADRAFLALLRLWKCPHPCMSYRAVRMAGRLFNAPDDPPTLIIEKTASFLNKKATDFTDLQNDTESSQSCWKEPRTVCGQADKR